MMHQGNYSGQFSPMQGQIPNSPMQGPAGPNDWLAMMQSRPKTWADVQGPAQQRPPSYPVVGPGNVPATGAPGPVPPNPMGTNPAGAGMEMMQAPRAQGGSTSAADIIAQRQEMSQAGLDRMQQIAAMMRQRMAG